MITSLTNPAVKQAAALEQRKNRKETGLFIAEGAEIMQYAKKHDWPPQTIFYSHKDGLVAWAAKSGASCLEAAPAVLSKLSTRDNPQTIVGVFPQRWTTLETVKSGTWLVLEEVRDPGNLGTIIRTADAAGVSGIILIGHCCDAYARESVRASMGSLFAVPLIKTTLDDFITWRQNQWKGAVIGTHLSSKTDFRAMRYPDSTLIVMGGESKGLSPTLTQQCSQCVRIPMQGSAESLNLAIATALILYETRRNLLVLA